VCRECGCGLEGWHQHEDGTWHSHHHHEHSHEHTHEHAHEYSHANNHVHSAEPSSTQTPLQTKKVVIESRQSVLAKNDQIAQDNREWFLRNKILCLNFISSPGSGKTLLLEKILERLSAKYKVCVIVGDQATSMDADRLENKGASIKQVNTHSTCHLDAPHIHAELQTFVKPGTDIVIIENVGNLVCPAMFDLGESAQIALLSTPEGEEKPVKYPVLFSRAHLVVLTKMDLVPHLKWSLEKVKNHIRRLNALCPIIPTSAQSGLGLDTLVDWIDEQRNKIKSIEL